EIEILLRHSPKKYWSVAHQSGKEQRSAASTVRKPVITHQQPRHRPCLFLLSIRSVLPSPIPCNKISSAQRQQRRMMRAPPRLLSPPSSATAPHLL
uniref:Uncharacterized protein n=1 Tax=Aegilops tauschii subsp. strangulata TaxID=200361 RepID=A0A453KKE0_AEGTS